MSDGGVVVTTEADEPLYTLADLSRYELVSLSLSSLLERVSLPFNHRDWTFVKNGIKVIHCINTCTDMGRRQVDLFDFAAFLKSEGIDLFLYYGSTTKRVKGIRFQVGALHYPGALLCSLFTFPQMRQTFLLYDPKRHTPETLAVCCHIGAPAPGEPGA